VAGTENYSVVMDADASPGIAAFNQFLAKLAELDQKMMQVGGRSLSPKITPQIDNSFLGGLNNELLGSKGQFNKVGQELGQSFQMGMQQQFGVAGGMASSLATALGPVGIVAGVAAVGVTALGAASVSAAKNWETLMAGVSKTTGVTGQELQNLSKMLLDLSTQMPVAQADLAKIAQVGGTLGVKQSDLPKFIKDVSMASAGWNMPAEQAAQQIAGISNAFKLPMSEADKFGSVINTMADNVGGSEDQIADFLVRASGIATTFNEAVPATAAFGAVLASINMPMEVAASGLQSMMAYAQADPKRMTAWADMMGISVEQLKGQLETDLYGTLIKSADAIKTVGSEADQNAKRIALWGEGGSRVAAGLTGMGEKYAGALEMANEQMETGASLLEAFGAQGATTDAALQRMSNSLSRAAIELGTVLLPGVTAVVNAMSDGINIATAFGEAIYGATAPVVTGAMQGTEKAVSGAASWYTSVMGFNIENYRPEDLAASRNTGQAVGSTLIAGMQYGMEANAPKIQSFIKDNLGIDLIGAAKNMGQTAGAAAADAFGDEWRKAHGAAAAAGYWLAEPGKGLANSMYTTSLEKDVTSGKKTSSEYALSFLGQEYTRKLTKSNKSLYEQILGPGGEALTPSNLVDTWPFEPSQVSNIGKGATDAIAENYYASMSKSVVNWGKFAEDHAGRMGDRVGEIFSDGIYTDLEKAENEAYLKFLDLFEKEHKIEFKEAGLDKIKEQIESLGKSVEINLKPVWEDWGSEQFRSKWTYENQDWLKYLTPGERDDLMKETARMADLQQNGNEQEKAIAANYFGALEGIKTGVQDQSLSSQAYFDQSLITMQGIAPAISAVLDKYLSVWASGSAGGRGMTGGESFYDWSYKPQYYSGYGRERYGNVLTSSSFMNYSGVQTGALSKNTLKAAWKGPVMQKGGYTGSYEGLAYLHPNEMVLPMEDILVNQQFAQYPVRITPPTSYAWGKGGLPPVTMTGQEPVAWLADQQKTGMEYLEPRLRAMQEAYFGKSMVAPWFASGAKNQPEWWSSAATAMSPGYASAWNAQKGGEMPKIGTDTLKNAKNQYVYDPRNDSCIQVSENAGLGLRTNDPFWLAKGATSLDTPRELQDIADASEGTEKNTRAMMSMANRPAVSGLNGVFPVTSGGASGQRGGNMVWKEASGAIMRYDPRTDTCDTLGMAAPEPSMKTLDWFYLGLTENNPVDIPWEQGGWGGQHAQFDYARATPEQIAAYEAAVVTKEATKKTAENTEQSIKYQEQAARYQQQMASVFGTAGAAGGPMLYSGAGGGSGITGFANRGGGWYFGGTSISGGGAHIGGGASASGWGAGASGGASGGFGGSRGYGSVSWAEGGFADGPTYGLFGEAGREAFVPISDRAAGLRILPRVMSELGVRAFAKGGIVGGSNLSARFGDFKPVYAPVIQGAGLSKSELLDVLETERIKWMRDVEEEFYNAGRR
jgi:TP901 family phage tail tape measure protein